MSRTVPIATVSSSLSDLRSPMIQKDSQYEPDEFKDNQSVSQTILCDFPLGNHSLADESPDLIWLAYWLDE
eukprot:gene1150-254_t